jgi:hypothetical protein
VQHEHINLQALHVKIPVASTCRRLVKEEKLIFMILINTMLISVCAAAITELFEGLQQVKPNMKKLKRTPGGEY